MASMLLRCTLTIPLGSIYAPKKTESNFLRTNKRREIGHSFRFLGESSSISFFKGASHGENQTSDTAASKQKEEGPNSYQYHHYYYLQFTRGLDCVVPSCYISTFVPEDNDAVTDLKKFDLPSYAILNTSKGLVFVELHKEASPEIVDRFLDLCQKGYFKGMPFHIVIKNYVIQGGNDIQGLGAAEDWIMKGKSHSESAVRPKHEAFMLGTSKAKDGSKEFDLFITTAPIPDLNDKLNVFGRVIKGEDVVQEIEEVDTDEHYHPKSAIGIIDIQLKQEI